jgi:hypothetical protein
MATMPGTRIAKFRDIRASCPLCGSTTLRHEFNLNFYETYLSWDRCKNCSLVLVEQRGCHLGVAKHAGPFTEGEIRSDARTCL